MRLARTFTSTCWRISARAARLGDRSDICFRSKTALLIASKSAVEAAVFNLGQSASVEALSAWST
jgi:hypothetical protein